MAKEQTAQVIFRQPDQRKGFNCIGLQIGGGEVRELVELPEGPGFSVIGARIPQDKGDSLLAKRGIKSVNLVED